MKNTGLSLVTTAIQDFWNSEGRPLLLGPWCLINEENNNLFRGKDYVLMPTPWKPANKIKEAADYCHNIYENLLPQLAEKLNILHGVSFPEQYWRILIGPWLLFFIGVFFERYRRIEETLSLFPNFSVYALSPNQCRLSTNDTFDFFRNSNDDYYNLKLFSVIVRNLCPNNTIEKNCRLKVNTYRLRYSWKGRLLRKLTTYLDLFFKTPIVLSEVPHLNFYDVIMLRFKMGLKTISYLHFDDLQNYNLHENYTNKARELLELKGASDRFQSLLFRIIPGAIPYSYIENYQLIQKKINNTNAVNSVKIIGSSVGWYFHETFKFFCAESVLKGVKFIEFQCGGGYGSLLSLPQENLSLEKDIFCTWGWKDNNDTKTHPLPSPYLSKLKDTHLQRLSKLLFIGTSSPKYHYAFQNELFPDDMAKYFNDKRIFFQALEEKIRNNILYRPYRYKYGWKEEGLVKDACPNIKFLEKGKLVNCMKKAKLVVIDHPHTSFLEALVINIPCIFYWDQEINLMRPEAQEYFEDLIDAGIIYKDPESAANKVNEIYDNSKEWWLKKHIQKARLDFCNRYAFAAGNWRDIWAKEFKQLL